MNKPVKVNESLLGILPTKLLKNVYILELRRLETRTWKVARRRCHPIKSDFNIKPKLKTGRENIKNGTGMCAH